MVGVPLSFHQWSLGLSSREPWFPWMIWDTMSQSALYGETFPPNQRPTKAGRVDCPGVTCVAVAFHGTA